MSELREYVLYTRLDRSSAWKLENFYYTYEEAMNDLYNFVIDIGNNVHFQIRRYSSDLPTELIEKGIFEFEKK